MVVSSISDMDDKRMFGPGLLKWMGEHTGELRKWLDTNVNYSDRDPFIERLRNDELLLYAMKMILEQDKLPNEDKIVEMVRELAETSGKLWLLIGAKRKGKTSLLHVIGETFKRMSKRPVWWYGPPAKLPKYIDGQTLDQDKIPPGSLVLIDEASVIFFSRLRDESSMDFIKRIPILAHADKNYIFCTQSSAISDVNIARLCMPIDTLIHTPNGLKKLSSIQENETVYSYDLKLKKIVEEKAFPFQPEIKETLNIQLENGEIIECSYDHKFLTKRGFIKAKNLRTNDKLFKVNATWSKIIKISEGKKQKMMDIFVTNNHNFILKNGIVAHNCDAFIFKSYSVIQGAGGKMDRIHISDQLKMFMPNKVNEAMYFDNTKIMLFKYPLPKWWNDAFSKPYAPLDSEAEYYRFVLSILADGVSVKKAIEMTGLRGRTVTQNDLESIRMLADHYGNEELQTYDDETLVELMTAGFDDTPINLQAQGIFKKMRGNFMLPPFDAETDMRRRRNDMEYDLMSRRNINQLFIDHYRFRIEHKGNLVISVIGMQQQTTRGTGKSWSTLSLGEFCNFFFDKPFTADNVKFDPNEVIKKASELNERDTVTQDEQRKEDSIGCLHRNTLIKTQNGLQRIKDIKSNVLTYNFRKGIYEYKLPTLVHSGMKEIFELNTTKGSIFATLDHKFFTEFGWLPLSSIISLFKALYVCSSNIKHDHNKNNMFGMRKRILKRKRQFRFSEKKRQDEIFLLTKMYKQSTLKTNVRKQCIKELRNSKKNIKGNKSMAYKNRSQRKRKIYSNYKRRNWHINQTTKILREPLENKRMSYMQKNIQNKNMPKQDDMRTFMCEQIKMEKRNILANERSVKIKWQKPKKHSTINRTQQNTTQTSSGNGRKDKKTKYRTLQKISGKTSECDISKTTKPDEKIDRTSNFHDITENRINLQQGLFLQPFHTNKNIIKMGGFRNTIHKTGHRMRWKTLSRGNKRQATRFRTVASWMENFKIDRKGNNKKSGTLQIKDIISFERIGIHDTYDLKVPDNHNFVLANGLIVHNSGSGAIRMEAADFEDTIRKKQINLIYASPSIRIHNNDLILEAYGIDYKQRISRFLVYQRYPGLPLGYITLAAPSEALTKEYEKRKDAFLEDILARETMMKKIKAQYVKQLEQDEVYANLRGKSKKLAYIRKKCPELRTKSAQEEVMNDVDVAAI